MNQKKFTVKVKALLIREDNFWVIQGLEFDINAYGKTIPNVIESFKKTLLTQTILDTENGKKPLECIEKAPKYYWDLFNKSECYKLATSTKKVAKEKVPTGKYLIPNQNFELVETRICA